MILVDSNILIRFSRGDQEAAKWLETSSVNDELFVSVVSKLELLVGSRDKRNLNEIRRFLYRYPVIELTPDISRQAVDLIQNYYLSHNLQVADSLIAATALVNGYELATINKKDFRYINGLMLAEYP